MSKKSRKKTTTAQAKPTVGKTSKSAVKSSVKKTAKKAAKKPAKTALKSSQTINAKALRPTRIASTTTSSTATKAKTAKAAAKSSKKASGLIEGAIAPVFRLPRDGGATVSLADYAGQKLVIFFYPRADTPGCTREAIDFTRLSDEFAAVKTALLGVSADPMKAQESFQKKHSLSMPLMSDETHTMLASYGAWGEKSMYGKTFEGVLRTTVLIGTDGRIAKIWHGVKVDGHADEVLEAARSI